MADDIQAVLELDDSQWTAGIRRAGENLRKFQSEVDQSFKDLEKSAGNPFGNLAAGIASLGLDRLADQLRGLATSIAGPFVAAGQAATNFEAEMRNVNSVAQLSQADFSSFSDTVAGLGRELKLGVGPAESAAGAYDIVSAGFTDAADAEAILRESLRGSKAGLTEVATASDLLTTAIAAYGLQAQDAARVNDVLFQTVAAGKTTYGELAQSFGQVATIAAQNGVSLEELGASIALLTQRGLKTPEAINAIRASIVQLSAPTEEAIKAQQAFGLNINRAAIQQRGFISVLNEVVKATDGNATAQRKILGDVTALNAALGLTSDGGAKFVEILGQMQGASGATDKALSQQQQSLKANLDRFNAAMERAGVVATQLFLPALTKIVQVGTGVVEFFSGLPRPVLAAGVAVGLLAAGQVALIAGALSVAAAIGTAGTAIAAFGGVASVAAIAADAFAVAEVAVAVATLPLEVAIGGLAAVIVGAAAAVLAAGAALAIYTEILKENTKADEEALKIEEARAKALRENKGLLEKTAQEIVAAGKGSKDVAGDIAGLQDQLTAARRTGNKDLIANLQGQIADAQQLKKEVAEIEAANKSAADSSVALNTTVAGTAKSQKDALEDEIQAIKLSEKSDQQKADSLNALIGKYRLEGQERRQIEADVARLRRKAEDDEEKGVENLIASEVKLSDVRIEGWKKDLAAGKDVGKQLEAEIRKRTQLEIDGIRQRAQAQLDQEADPTRRQQIQDTAANAETAARIKGEQEVAAARKAGTDEANKLAKERTDAEVKSNQLAQEAIDKRLEALQREAQLGRDTFAEQAKLIKQKADLQVAATKKAAQQDAAEAKDPAAKASILSNADAEAANIKKQSELDLQQLERDRAQQAVQNQQRELGLTKELKDAQIDALKQQAEQGKNVTEQLRRALLDRLALQEEEIRLNAEAAKAATNSAQEQALIEQEAQAKIIQARLAARKEINDTIGALEKQKAAQEALSGGVGDTQTFEEFLKSQADVFGSKAVREQSAAITSRNRVGQPGQNVSGLSTRAQDLLDVSTALPGATSISALSKTPDQVAAVAQRQQAQADAQAQANLRATQSSGSGGAGLLGTVRVEVGVDPENGSIHIEEAKAETTVNGRGSRLELIAAGLSPHSNKGGA